jgi:putative chitinase
MATTLTTAQFHTLAPNARTNYQTAFADSDAVFAEYEIDGNPRRVRHFLAQVLHETDGLTILVESMNYRAERIVDVWPSRFPNVAAATPYAHNPEGLAEKVYGGRMGNDNPGDGWKYIGRGLLQITGRESYEKFGQRLGIDLVGNPDLATSGEWALKIAASEWKASGCNGHADNDDLREVTRVINGGYIGLSSRHDWLERTLQLFPD